MSVEVYQSSSFAEVYAQLVRDCLYVPHEHPLSRNEYMLELTNTVIQFPADTIPIIQNVIRSANQNYLAGEFIWYYSGSNSLDFIEDYSKFWTKIATPQRTCNSAYGNLLFRERLDTKMCQYEYAYRTLLADKGSRRATMLFLKPHYQDIHSKDIPCTVSATFHIRDSILHMKIHMRSSDLHYGLIYDAPFFVSVVQHMRNHLSSVYKSLLLGNVTMFFDSVHIYRSQAELFKRMAYESFTQIEMPMVKENLINQVGAPSHNTTRLYNDAAVYTDDELLNWLETKSLTNTKERAH
jgi:thymidylate synthase